MHDDDGMDRLLSNAFAAEAPRLSPGFDARLMRRLKPRRLTGPARVVLAAYVAAAIAISLWLMRGLHPDVIALALVLGGTLSAGASAYGRRVAGVE
jgi:hypothetical protein